MFKISAAKDLLQ